MKDWEISGSYLLPRILCLKTRSKTLPSKLPKTNLRFLPLSDENDRWTVWRSSDCFYPEMIPEPDYSDSGDEIVSDDEEERSLRPGTTGAFESLRDLTEVYVTSEEQKKEAPAQKKPISKRGKPSPKKSPTEPAKAVAKDASDKSKTPDKTQASGAKTPPRQSPKVPTKASKAPQKSEVKATKTKAKAKPADTEKASPSGESKPTPVAKRKTEEKEVKDKTSAKEPSSAQTKTAPAKISPASERKVSPSSAAKPKAAVKPKQDLKTAPKETAAGDAKTAPITKKPTTAKAPPTPPTSDKSMSPTSTPASTEPSSDEEQLIKPKKPVNPYLQSTERQKLHKELKFSQKYGKLGASQKTELQLALQRYTENKEKRELLAEEKSSFEQILELQARKIEMQEKMEKHPPWMDRLQRPPSATWSDPRTDEFYRVHARVVSSNLLTHCFLPDDEGDCLSPRKLSSDSGSDG